MNFEMTVVNVVVELLPAPLLEDILAKLSSFLSKTRQSLNPAKNAIKTTITNHVKAIVLNKIENRK